MGRGLRRKDVIFTFYIRDSSFLTTWTAARYGYKSLPSERGSDFIHDSLLTRKLFHINVIDSNGFSDKRANKSLAVLVA